MVQKPHPECLSLFEHPFPHQTTFSSQSYYSSKSTRPKQLFVNVTSVFQFSGRQTMKQTLQVSPKVTLHLQGPVTLHKTFPKGENRGEGNFPSSLGFRSVSLPVQGGALRPRYSRLSGLGMHGCPSVYEAETIWVVRVHLARGANWGGVLPPRGANKK